MPQLLVESLIWCNQGQTVLTRNFCFPSDQKCKFKKKSIHLSSPSSTFPPSPFLILPWLFLHYIFSHSSHSPISAPHRTKFCRSDPVTVPEGALTLLLHFCSSPSCGAAEGLTKGSPHLRGQPTSSWESSMKLRAERKLTAQQTCLFATKWTGKESNPEQWIQNVGWGSCGSEASVSNCC